MADEKPRSNNLTPKPDPTMDTETVMGVVAEYPPGTHPIAPLSEQAFSAENKEYSDMPDKPDPSTVAQVEVRTDEKQ